MRYSVETAKESCLSAQDRYDIISMAMQQSETNGFLNFFVYERALHLFTMMILYPEKKVEIQSQFVDGRTILEIWQTYLENGELENMIESNQEDFESLVLDSETWYEDYDKFCKSARGLMGDLQLFAGDSIQESLGQLTEVIENEDISNVINIADQWGKNNPV